MSDSSSEFIDADENEPVVLIICAGPPYCSLSDNEAVKAQENGCIWCSKIYSYDDGRADELIQPGEA